MFTCDEIKYTDNTYGWSTVVQNSALTTFNSTLSQQADKIALVVEESQGTNVIKAASIVTAINGATSTVAISADHINLNGAVTANNNVTIDQNGYITAVGATLTNANISGGQMTVNTSNDSFDVITLNGSASRAKVQSNGVVIENKSGNTVTGRSELYGQGWSMNEGDRWLSGGNPVAQIYHSSGLTQYQIAAAPTTGFKIWNTAATNNAAISFVNQTGNKVRMRLNVDEGLTFIAADGGRTALYPSNGKIMVPFGNTLPASGTNYGEVFFKI